MDRSKKPTNFQRTRRTIPKNGHRARRPLLAAGLMVWVLLVPVLGSAQSGGPDLSQMDHEVRSHLLDARLAMRDLTPCDLERLTALARLMDRKMRIMTMEQRWVFGVLQRMARQLNSILSDMERYIPDGEPNPYLEGTKTALAASGLIPIPPLNAVSFTAGLFISGLEAYAKEHNAAQARPILRDIMERANRQIEAFNGAVDIHNDISAAMKEIAGYQARIQGLIATYQERCVKAGGTWGDESYDFVDESPQQVSRIVPDADGQMAELDECDYDQLTRLGRLMDDDMRRLTAAQRRLFEELLARAGELDDIYGDLKAHFPEGVDSTWETQKVLAGVATKGNFVAGSVIQAIDFVGGSDAAVRVESTKDSVARRANLQIERFNTVAGQFNALSAAMRTIEVHKARLLELIRTWEERCQKTPTAIRIDDDSVSGPGVAYDRTQWCTYGSETVSITDGPVSIPDGPIYIPIGQTPGGGGTPEPGTSPDGRPPRPEPAAPPGTVTTAQNKDRPVPEEDKTKAPPVIIVKAKQSVLEGDAPKPVANLVVRLNLSPTPQLPIAGNRKDDEGHDHVPVQGLTGPDGSIRLFGTAEGKDESTRENEPGPTGRLGTDPGPIFLAMGPEPVFRALVASDRSPALSGGTPPPAKTGTVDAKLVPVSMNPFKSYIVKIRTDRSLKNWRSPAAYVKNRELLRYIDRSWVKDGDMYLVVNIPAFPPLNRKGKP